ncbi:MAG: hypothetical protein ABI597_01865 [Gammaproteobacteria bacterium]
MKKIVRLCATVGLALSGSVLAGNVITLPKNNLGFAPVAWDIGCELGGFSLVNETTKKQYVQIVINTGSIYVFKRGDQKSIGCSAGLEAHTNKYSTICELEPTESLAVDLDFASPGCIATGTYQVEFEK